MVALQTPRAYLTCDGDINLAGNWCQCTCLEVEEPLFSICALKLVQRMGFANVPDLFICLFLYSTCVWKDV
jgi:hypothetical protein